MSRKQMEALDAPTALTEASVPLPEVSQDYKLEIALQIALSHHKTNGGMLTPAQLIENAKQFHAYISGEQA